MFEVLYKISDPKGELEAFPEIEIDTYMNFSVVGYFAFYVNKKEYGFYIEESIKQGLSWADYITSWFIDLISAYLELTRFGYVLINDTDSYNTWIEFERVKDMAKISIIRAEKGVGTYSGLRLSHIKQFEYGEWYNESVKLVDIRTELIRKALQYLEELRKINIKLFETREVAELKEVLSQLIQS